MYQLNILHTKEKKDTYVSYAGDMNICTIKNSAVDNDKNILPPPRWVNVVIYGTFYMTMHCVSEILRIYYRAA